MLVSHESPLALLEKSREYNDYSYALVHLFEKYPEYYNFFKEEKERGRGVLLDNSLFELGEAFNSDEFAHWIDKLQPTEYVVPDVFSDGKKTADNFKNWVYKYNHLKGKKIGVVQGKTLQEMVDCYTFMCFHADKVAINFISSYFITTGYSLNPNATQWHRLMEGRKKFITDLINDDIWDWHKPVHLLGCTIPIEFKYYNNIQNYNGLMTIVPNIESIDTSNPVVAGMHNIRYNENGLDDKCEAKLADLMEVKVTEENINNILYNVSMFRKINNIK